MPNNVTLPGTGSVVEAVEVGGALRQVVQVANMPDTQPVSAEALAQALASGQVDPHPDAVAYAEGLKA